jgi:hypothetical protein
VRADLLDHRGLMSKPAMGDARVHDGKHMGSNR